MKNLVLIGMPGSGKTKMGVLLARRFSLEVLDTDAMVVQEAGMTIPELFDRFGEAHFRDLETQAVKKAARAQGAVIATGGGVILREENMAALAQTGIIFFRDRPPEAIVGEDHKGRPLVGADKDAARERIFRLYAERIGLYKRYAHHYIPPTDTYQEAAELIAAIYEREVKKA